MYIPLPVWLPVCGYRYVRCLGRSVFVYGGQLASHIAAQWLYILCEWSVSSPKATFSVAFDSEAAGL